MNRPLAEIDRAEFWFIYFCSHFGAVSDEEIDDIALQPAFSIDFDCASEWWDDFTQSYDGVFEEADGQIEDPTIVQIPFASSVYLQVQFHPGDTYFGLTDPVGGALCEIGNVGPHWRLPFFRWQEVLSLVAATKLSTRESEMALLLMLPGVWFDSKEMSDPIITRIQQALTQIGFIRASHVSWMAKLLHGALISSDDFRWSDGANGMWYCDSDYSYRTRERSALRIQGLLNHACGNSPNESGIKTEA